VEGIRWAFSHSKPEIQVPGVFVFGVNHERPHTRFFGYAEATLQSIFEKAPPNALTLVVHIDGESRHK
jgi:hypothetical protein